MTDEPLKPRGEIEQIDLQKRLFLKRAAGILGGLGSFCALTPFVFSWLPSARVVAAGAPVQVDLSQLKPGQQITVIWQGKPVWIIRRTKEMLERLLDNTELLRDPQSLANQQPEYAKNIYRSINPEYLVLIGLCTHLGCVPKYLPDKKELNLQWEGGFYCPCHSSTFDLAGRVFKGVPAPLNLEVPPYRFINGKTLIIGQDEKE